MHVETWVTSWSEKPLSIHQCSTNNVVQLADVQQVVTFLLCLKNWLDSMGVGQKAYVTGTIFENKKLQKTTELYSVNGTFGWMTVLKLIEGSGSGI